MTELVAGSRPVVIWPATNGKRLCAYIVDAIVVQVVVALTAIAFSSLVPKKDRRIGAEVDGVPVFRVEPGTQPDWTPAALAGTALVIVAVVWLVFFVALIRWDATLGKRLMNLRVVRPDGSELSVVRKAVRAAVQPFCIVFPGGTLVNGVMVLVGKRSRSLNDFAAGSLVVDPSDLSRHGYAGAVWAD